MKGPILVIDDEKSIRDIVGSCLRQHGYSVEMAGSAEEAIRVCSEQSIKLIILDVVLPDCDGLELLTVLKRKHPQVPIIIATGNEPTNSLINTAKERGASGFASKTALLSELLQQVETLMNLE
jgi:two-component system, NtrC family, nitrogen regulation response regulator NtrX